MTDLSPELLAIIMMGGMLAGVFLGYPLAVVVGAVGILTGFLVFGQGAMPLIYERLFTQINNYTLLAIPLFVFMGVMLESSGITDRLYDALYVLLGGFHGGLAVATILIGTIMAACVGIVGASVTMLALVALPSMLNKGYDKALACGSVCAGGTLGQLIPPSILLVIYGPMALVSVGKLFMGAFIPGLILSAMYCLYVAIRCRLRPSLAPVVAEAERAIPISVKTQMLLKSLLPPLLLILAVLGSIFFGIAPPTEAAAVGAFAATLLAIIYRTFNLRVLSQVTERTLRVTAMIMLIGALSFAFTGVFLGAGCGKAVEALILAAPGGRWGAFVLVMFVMFLLGFFIDVIGIVFIIVPIVAPLAPTLGFDPLWFGMMIMINLQMAFMTPPFAVTIFYLRGIVKPEWEVTMGDIMRGVLPFVGLIIIGLVLCTVFPELITWLPGKMIR